jgi:hypothetical protein
MQVEAVQDAVEQARLAEGMEALRDGLPFAEALGQVAPGTPGAQVLEHAVDGDAVVLPRAVALALRGKEGSDQLPLSVGKFVPYLTK